MALNTQSKALSATNHRTTRGPTPLGLSAAGRRTSEVRGTSKGEGTPTAKAPTFVSVTSVGLEPITEMEKTIKWLSDERLTKLIPVFEENEAVLDDIVELSEEELEEFINELPHSILLKKRLRKAVAKLREEIEQKESTPFLFDTSISTRSIQPERFKVSTDRKTATLTHGEFGGQILLTPKISKGIYSLEFCIEEITGNTFIGVVNDCTKELWKCCAFDSNGFVQVNDVIVAKRQSFGGWKKGDRIILIADLGSGKLTIKAPNGEYSADIQSLRTPLWFAFLSFKHGTSVTVNETSISQLLASKSTVQSSVSCVNCSIL